MNYSVLFSEIIKFINSISDYDYTYNREMAEAIETWLKVYQNKPPWLSDTVKTLNLAGSIAAEFAKLVTLESYIGVSGSPLADIINKEITDYVAPNLRKYVEYGLAAGSFVLKPMVIDNELYTQFILAGDFFPLAFDTNGNITEVVFVSQFSKNNETYTLLERHRNKSKHYIVENYCFVSKQKNKLGNNVPLASVTLWADLPEKTEIENVSQLPFGMFSLPFANQIDNKSLLGVSVYSRALDLIEEADKRYSSLCWEYESKQTAVYVSENAFSFDKNTGKAKLPEGKERLYVPLDISTGVQDDTFLDVFSPAIRSNEIIEGISEQLRLIEFNCSLAYGSLSNPQSVEKTAEEIRSSKERSYAFVKDVQNALEKTIIEYINACEFWLSLYGVASSIGEIEINIEWRDSVAASDPEKERENDRLDLANGTLRPEEYRAKYRNETLEEALANLPTQIDVIV